MIMIIMNIYNKYYHLIFDLCINYKLKYNKKNNLFHLFLNSHFLFQKLLLIKMNKHSKNPKIL